MTADAPSLILVVPCYNEAARFDQAAFAAVVPRWPNVSFLFVDDGSTDETRSVLERAAAALGRHAVVLSLQGNRGKAEAVRQGMLAAFAQRPDCAGYWDADLATPFEVLPDFFAVLDARPQTDIVLGSRIQLLGHHIVRSSLRHYVGRVFATGASHAIDLRVYDTQCGAKIFRNTERVRQVFATPFQTRWVFDVELLGRYVDADGAAGRAARIDRLYELPLAAWTDVPGSKVRLRDGWRAFIDLARVHRGRYR
jgi:dolichyl-phosphate beta-glucosyltransferase